MNEALAEVSDLKLEEEIAQAIARRKLRRDVQGHYAGKLSPAGGWPKKYRYPQRPDAYELRDRADARADRAEERRANDTYCPPGPKPWSMTKGARYTRAYRARQRALKAD